LACGGCGEWDGAVGGSTIPLNTWTRVELDVTFGAPTHATTKLASATVFDGDLTFVWTPPSAEIGFGINYAATSEPIRVRMDNVIVDLQGP
jgi:hypothetical protein